MAVGSTQDATVCGVPNCVVNVAGCGQLLMVGGVVSETTTRQKQRNDIDIQFPTEFHKRRIIKCQIHFTIVQVSTLILIVLLYIMKL